MAGRELINSSDTSFLSSLYGGSLGFTAGELLCKKMQEMSSCPNLTVLPWEEVKQ